ncbi:hypothetical protein MTR_4g061847 [Medicago truncatula]|uniref:Uncharacterized protein n=1 Tax=Medicago truncatula TaxID=3880 RepID=A0A072UK57_MEDTR|nr:hypothetical protein MTR_4g061847 [Medicago truncatula]
MLKSMKHVASSTTTGIIRTREVNQLGFMMETIELLRIRVLQWWKKLIFTR